MKKMNEQGFHVWIIILIVVVVAGLGFGGWYVWEAQKDDEASSETATPTPTPSAIATPTPATIDYLATLRTFCENYRQNIDVIYITYYESDNGKYANCGIGYTNYNGGGGYLVAYFSNNNWQEIYYGNGTIDNDLCSQYEIPSTISSNCLGNY